MIALKLTILCKKGIPGFGALCEVFLVFGEGGTDLGEGSQGPSKDFSLKPNPVLWVPAVFFCEVEVTTLPFVSMTYTGNPMNPCMCHSLTGKGSATAVWKPLLLF